MDSEPPYEAAIELSGGARWVPRERLEHISRLIGEVVKAGVPGGFAEFGVARGTSASIIGWHARRLGRHLSLFDTFEGLPEPTAADGDRAREFIGKCRGGDYMDTVNGILRVARSGPEEPTRQLSFSVYPGLFQSNTEHMAAGFAFVHIDADWYESYMTVLRGLSYRRGTVIVCDDYAHWQGAKKAIDEWTQHMRWPLVFNDHSQCYWMVPS